MANQHQDPNRPRPTAGTKGDPPSRRPGAYPDTTPDVIAGNQPGRANAKNPGRPPSEDQRPSGDSGHSQNQDPRRSGAHDRSSGDENHQLSSGDGEPTDRR